MENPQENTSKKIHLEIPPDIEAIYSNQVLIAHSPSELVFNFAQMLPGSSGPKVKAQVMMSPLGAKLFYRALGENLAKFEANFGEINMPVGSTLADHLFRPPQKPPQE
jgi:hypothetical protein